MFDHLDPKPKFTLSECTRAFVEAVCLACIFVGVMVLALI